MFCSKLSALQKSTGVLSLAAFVSSHAIGAAEIESVVVTATASEHQLNTAPASISIITAAEIQQMPVKDLGDVLRKSVGVTVTSITGGRNSIYIRGLDEDYVLMLVNGRRVSSSNGLWRGGNFDITSIPLEAIERVEVVRGPMSALYGSDAVGGVVNVITRQPEDDWITSLDVEFSQMQDGEGGDRTRNHLFTSGKLSPSVGAMLSVEISEQDVWLSPEVTPNFDTIEGRETQKVMGTLSWQINGQQSLDFDFANNQDDVPPTDYGGAIREQTLDRNTLGIMHSGNWGWGSTYLLANREVSDIYDYNSRYFAQPPLGRDIEETNTTLRATTAFEVGSQALTLGTEFLETEIADIVQYPAKGGDSVSLISLFAQDEITISENLIATLGLRFEDNDAFGDHLSPRLYLVYHPSSLFTLKGGVGTAFRAPSLFESSPTFASVSCRGICIISGNSELEPETSQNTELAILFDADNWNASITAYRNKVEDLINVGAWDGVATSRTYYNEDEVTIEGLELSGSTDLGETLTVKANYTYTKTENTLGNELEYRPENAGNLGLDWQTTANFNTFISANYFGDHINFTGAEQPGYTQIDLGGNYALSENLTLRAGVTNANDEQPVLDDPTSEAILQGRAIFVGLNLKL